MMNVMVMNFAEIPVNKYITFRVNTLIFYFIDYLLLLIKSLKKKINCSSKVLLTETHANHAKSNI